MENIENTAYEVMPPPLIPTDAIEADTEEISEAPETAAETVSAEAIPETTSESDADENAEQPSEAGEFPTEEEIRKVIYEVVDPEIQISIIDLGLVYEIIPNPEDRTVHIKMTLTSPGCPLGPEITAAVYLKVTRLPGVKDCNVELVWSPMWDPMVHANEETRMALGIW